MLIETISGKCPCCGYDKMIQRYGSDSDYNLDACPNCGFAFGDNRIEHKYHQGAWLNYFIHRLICADARYVTGSGTSYLEVLKDYRKLSPLEIRWRLFEYVEEQERSNAKETTVFFYPTVVIHEYRASNPVIFKKL